MGDGRLDQAGKQWMGRRWLAFEFRVELNGNEPGVVGDFNNFHEALVGTGPGDDKPGLFKLLAVAAVELVAVAVAFGDLEAAVGSSRATAGREVCRLASQPHGSALLGDTFLFLHQADDRMGRVAEELSGVGLRQARGMPGEVDDGALHAEADSEKRQLSFPGIANRLHFAFDAAFPEASGNNQGVKACQQTIGAFLLDVLTFDRLYADLGLVRDPAMIECLVDALVGIPVFGVLADEGNRNFMFRVAEAMEDVMPAVEGRW